MKNTTPLNACGSVEQFSCADCHEKLTMHADGTVACSCAMFSDPDDANEAVPSGWNATREDIYRLQLAESDYVEQDAREADQEAV
jgi:hypothetical protein